MLFEFFVSLCRCAILVDEEFSCLEFDMNRDTISWIRRKIEYRRSLMEHLPKKTCQNDIIYTLVGDYYIPALQLPEENRPLGFGGVCTKSIWNCIIQPGIMT